MLGNITSQSDGKSHRGRQGQTPWRTATQGNPPHPRNEHLNSKFFSPFLAGIGELFTVCHSCAINQLGMFNRDSVSIQRKINN